MLKDFLEEEEEEKYEQENGNKYISIKIECMKQNK